jgi:hypothetical protein
LDLLLPPLQNPNVAFSPSPEKNFDSRIVYYLHIHKARGTIMCFAGRRNGMLVSPTNSSGQEDQRCCGVSYNFVASEKEMRDARDPEHYRYVVMFRDSYTRYQSHWQHVTRE